MTFEELKIQLDLNEPIDILKFVGRQTKDNDWFVICDNGNCHLFDNDGNEINIKKIKSLKENLISKDIKKIIVPNSIESIKNGAFFDCKKLTSINIPNSIKSIGDVVFAYCESLTSINILDSVKHIGDYAFAHCKSLTSIIIPNSIKHIGDTAFAYCEKLTSINIPDSVEYIGYDVFYACRNLKSIIFKDKTIEQVKSMNFYPWGIEDELIIKCIN